MKSVPSYSSPSAILGIWLEEDCQGPETQRPPRGTAMDGGSAANAGRDLRPAVRRGTYALRAQDVDQTLRLAALIRIAFVEHLLENAARTLWVAHVDIRTREVEL